jgi:site-specific DNA-methyltransferase (adenine-specific)
MNTDCVITGDCFDVLPTLPAGLANLLFADVPFNIGLAYPGYDDSRPPGEYLGFLEDRFRAARRVLSPRGSLVVASGTGYQAEVCVLLKGLGFHWRNTVCWHYTFGESQKRKFTPSWTALHYFVMDPRHFTFNGPDVRVRSTRQLIGDRRAKPGGKVPDDMWFLRPQEAEAEGFFDAAGDVWHVRRENGTFKGRVGHVCQMPLPILERIIRATTNPGDLVLDPFAGTGTTLVAARQLGRRYAARCRARNGRRAPAAPPPGRLPSGAGACR